MEDLARSDYPAMLANLQPGQAVSTVNDRVKRILKLNTEIADWLQERRRIEELYVQNLRKLTHFRVPNSASDLGVFQRPWERIIQSVEEVAQSHHLFASRVEKDVELPLRQFALRKETLNMNTITANLTVMAKDLEDARDKSDKLNRKGGKANAQKVDAASSKLDSTTSQWESQAPFILETLQVLDETRVNQLRDLLTQLETHESDLSQRNQTAAGDALAVILEVSTAQEVQSFAARTIAGRPVLEKRSTARQSLSGPSTSLAPTTTNDDTTSEHSGGQEIKQDNRLRSRFGTMLNRRRQSIHALGELSRPFTSRLGSSHGPRPGISPRPSFNNLAESNRLASLAESPESPKVKDSEGHEGTNGVDGADRSSEHGETSAAVNGTGPAVSGLSASDRTPSLNKNAVEPTKDSEGFTIPAATNDPISEAQKEAAEESDQLFKLSIQNSPVEEDPEAKQAAMSNVANTLTQMATPSRKTGTVRGRRDVRNTIYVPSPVEGVSENPFPALSTLAGAGTKPTLVTALATEASVAGTSDTQSVRSANSLASLAFTRHPDMTGPGLNCSIIESVSVTFEDGEAKNVKIGGEIAFSYNLTADAAFENKETIKINNFPKLEVIGPNRIFVRSLDREDQFDLDLSHLSKTSTGFTYRVHSDEASGLGAYAPLVVKPAWRPQGDKLGLLLQYSLNPASPLKAPVTLRNVVLVATYEDARASGVQTKPAGTHLKDKHLVYWRLGDVVLTAEPQRIVCRVVGEQNAEPRPGHVEARWEYAPGDEGGAAAFASGIWVSRLEESKGKGKAVDPEEEEDPFADALLSPAPEGMKWADVPVVRKLVSGKYDGR